MKIMSLTGVTLCLLCILGLGVEIMCRRVIVADDARASGPRSEYFPRVTLLTQDDREVEFYDLIRGRLVVINYMYTNCEGKFCTDGIRNLVRLQDALGDAFGRDVFMYSISLDPEHDTPDVLKEYARKHKARWTFLTAKGERSTEKIEDTTKLRNSLGLFRSDPEVDADPKKHNGMIIIGNEPLDKWDKTSVLSSPGMILQMIERTKPPAFLKD